MATGGKIKLEEGTGGGDHVGFKAPDTEVAEELLWTLPDVDGATGQVMATDGAKTLDWVTVDVAAEATARADADTTLQANVDAEITARGLADTTLQANVDAEITARGLADTTLQANVNTEITARTGADNTEITARSNADTTLQANVDAEITARGLADTTLQANVDAEITARSLADSTLTASLPNAVSQSGTATVVDALFPITHSMSVAPEVSLKVSDGTDYEYHHAGTYVKSSTTQIKTTGTTLAAQLGGSTPVILTYWVF